MCIRDSTLETRQAAQAANPQQFTGQLAAEPPGTSVPRPGARGHRGGWSLAYPAWMPAPPWPPRLPRRRRRRMLPLSEATRLPSTTTRPGPRVA
eukprot:11109885-Alexandrium_andersonii.AAC.1